MPTWLGPFTPIAKWLAALSGVFFLVGLVVLPLFVSRLRADYFTNPEPASDTWSGAHPVLRYTLRAFKSVMGALLILAGIAMLVLPGQGLLCIFLGLTLIEFPGKRRLELGLVRRPALLRAINWIRAKAGSAPLELPPETSAASTPGPSST